MADLTNIENWTDKSLYKYYMYAHNLSIELSKINPSLDVKEQLKQEGNALREISVNTPLEETIDEAMLEIDSALVKAEQAPTKMAYISQGGTKAITKLLFTMAFLLIVDLPEVAANVIMGAAMILNMTQKAPFMLGNIWAIAGLAMIGSSLPAITDAISQSSANIINMITNLTTGSIESIGTMLQTPFINQQLPIVTPFTPLSTLSFSNTTLPSQILQNLTLIPQDITRDNILKLLPTNLPQDITNTTISIIKNININPQVILEVRDPLIIRALTIAGVGAFAFLGTTVGIPALIVAAVIGPVGSGEYARNITQTFIQKVIPSILSGGGEEEKKNMEITVSILTPDEIEKRKIEATNTIKTLIADLTKLNNNIRKLQQVFLNKKDEIFEKLKNYNTQPIPISPPAQLPSDKEPIKEAAQNVAKAISTMVTQTGGEPIFEEEFE